jgi:hypothetical protein
MKNEKKVSVSFYDDKKNKEALIIKSDFLDYKKGSLIFDELKISEILESSFAHLVNKTTIE